MDFNWITPQEAAEFWEISDRRVQALCANGQVKGVIRLKRGWLIPKGTPKPLDGRAKMWHNSVRFIPAQPLLR